MRILVVDDEPALLRIVNMYLRRMGHDVVTAESGAGGCKILDADPDGFALALLDGTLAGERVQDLALRMLAISPALRVIVTSGYPVDMTGLQEAAPERAIFLQKPFTSQSLSAAVRRILGKKEDLSTGEGDQGDRARAHRGSSSSSHD